jgi:hypothetical protein
VLCSFWGGKKGRKEKFLFCFWRKTAKNPRFFRMYRFCQLKTIFCACFACGLLACVVLPSWWYVQCMVWFKFQVSSFTAREPLSPPLSTAPPGPTPCLFLGAVEWFVGECCDVLRNDLVFSTNAKSIHPLLEGQIEELQLPILNFLNGKDVYNLCKALRGGSKIVRVDEIIARGMPIVAYKTLII